MLRRIHCIPNMKKILTGLVVLVAIGVGYYALSPLFQNVEVQDGFFLHKIPRKIQDVSLDQDTFDLIYFDAFSTRSQPELWTAEIFRNLFDSLKVGGILVTYCAKGSVKRTLKSSGFSVETLPGPPGKREMIRALKWSK